MKRTLFITALLCIAVSVFAGDPVKPFLLPSARNNALGGPHVAYTNDLNSLFINPAALRTTKQLGIIDLNISTTGDIFRILPIITDAGDGMDFKPIGDFAEKSGGKLPFGFDLRFPLAAGYINNGIGFGLFDRAYADIQITGTNVDVEANGDLVLTGGYARRFDIYGQTFDAGAVAKFVFRENASVSDTILSLANSTDNLTDKISENRIFGGGINLGVTYYALDDKLKAALVWNDVVSPVYVNNISGPGESYLTLIDSKMNIGASYSILELDFVKLSAMADYRDIFNLFKQDDYRSRNPWLNIGIGAEAKFFNIVSVRVGMTDMLPAVGLGIDAKICQIETAIYGIEKSHEPGLVSTYGFDIGLLFRY
jgi:hypothetical protein